MTEKGEAIAIESGVGVSRMDEHRVEQNDRARAAFNCINMHAHLLTKMTLPDGAETPFTDGAETPFIDAIVHILQTRLSDGAEPLLYRWG